MGRVEARSQTRPGKSFTHPYHGLGFYCRAGCQPTPGNSRKTPLNEARTVANPCYDGAESASFPLEPDAVHTLEIRILSPEDGIVESDGGEDYGICQGKTHFYPELRREQRQALV